MAKAKVEWVYAGTEDLVGAVVTYVGWNEFLLEKDGVEFKLIIEQDWGYCYCYDYDDGGRCSCTPTIDMRAQRRV